MTISNLRIDVASSAEGCTLTFDSWSCWNYTQPGEVNSSAEGCTLTFDSWSCWNYTQPGEVNLRKIAKKNLAVQYSTLHSIFKFRLASQLLNSVPESKTVQKHFD